MLTPCSMLLQTWSPGAHGSVAPRAPLEEPPPCAWPPWSWSASCPTPLVCSGGGFLLAAMMPEAGRYTHKKDDGICNRRRARRRVRPGRAGRGGPGARRP
uniref:Uncharacterized protein n=1 Tax=Triticum urartu TaxID=4572 RepID=A0A8R7Q0H9_TRIUA